MPNTKSNKTGENLLCCFLNTLKFHKEEHSVDCNINVKLAQIIKKNFCLNYKM
ncbi:hypothetical protein bpmyx0001_22180 [Bacillus pseudomycoides DSM 12442]|nr:hypothetical protein bpmyx0001_22180 [Bacillus pseudomycoides DSM 12442]